MNDDVSANNGQKRIKTDNESAVRQSTEEHKLRQTTSDMISMNDLGAPLAAQDKTADDKTLFMSDVKTNNDLGVKASWNQLLVDDLSAIAPVQPDVTNDVLKSKEQKPNLISSSASYAKVPDSKLQNSFKVNMSNDIDNDTNTRTTKTSKKQSRANSTTSSNHAPDYLDESDDDGFSLTCW